MENPALIIMAAGMGSRFGGLKQITPVGDNGEIIMDFSLYDAYQAGFRKVVFVIKKEREADFRAIVGDEPTSAHVPTASEVGVLGTVVGVIGTIQATEVIKWLTGTGDLLTDSILTFDALTWQFNKINI